MTDVLYRVWRDPTEEHQGVVEEAVTSSLHIWTEISTHQPYFNAHSNIRNFIPN